MIIQESSIQPEESVIRALLMQVPILHGAEEEFYHALASNLTYLAYEPNEAIITKGEMGHSMYLISSGAVRVMSEDEQHIITILVEGDIFGEMSLVFGEFRSASVYSHRFCELYRLERPTFERIVKVYPDIYERIKTVAVERKKLADLRQVKAKQSLDQLKMRVIAKKVNSMPLFEDIPESITEQLAQKLKPLIFSSGRYIVKEGEQGEHIYLVTKGQLDVLKGDGEVDTIAEGDIFGEMALIYNQPRSASVRVQANGYCELYQMDKQTFKWLTAQAPNFIQKVKELAAVRSNRLEEYVPVEEEEPTVEKTFGSVTITYTDSEKQVIKEGLQRNKKCVEVYLTLDKDLEIKSAPASHCIIALEKTGGVLKTHPPAEKIILNQIEQEIVLSLITQNSVEQILQDITGIEGIAHVDVTDISSRFLQESVVSPVDKNNYNPHTFINAQHNSFKLKAMLKSLKIFSTAEDRFLDLLSKELKPIVFQKDEFIFRKGDPGDGLYMIFKGFLAVLKDDDKTQLVTLKQGDVFGESAIIFQEARNASVKAKTMSELYKLPKQAFDKIVQQFPAIYNSINAVAKERQKVRSMRHSAQEKEGADKLKALIMARQIKKIDLFKGAEPAFFEAISKGLKSVVYQRGKLIIKEGEIGDAMYLMIRGEVEVSKDDFSKTLAEGDIFGESALIFEEPRNANVKALTFCELYRLEREIFAKIAAKFPAISYKMKELAKARSKESAH